MKTKNDIKNHEELFKYLKGHLCSLFSYKSRGETLQVNTMLSTVSDKFVSVFVKKLNNGNYIVSDGGFIDLGFYGVMPPDQDEEITSNVKNFLIEYYEVQFKEDNNILFYIKETPFNRLATEVFNMSEFIQGLVNSIHLEYRDKKVKEQQKRFKKQVNEFLRERFHKKVEFDYTYEDKIKFNASIVIKNNRYLIDYITGSNVNYYIKNLTETAVKFQMVNGAPYLHKISILNDETEGYVPTKVAPYIDFLKDKVKTRILPWKERDKLEKVISTI